MEADMILPRVTSYLGDVAFCAVVTGVRRGRTFLLWLERNR